MYPDPIPPHVYNVDEVIESLCQEGCKAVRSYITQLQKNTPIELLNGLTELEKQAVLLELQSIMAVYERCTIDQDTNIKPIQKEAKKELEEELH